MTNEKMLEVLYEIRDQKLGYFTTMNKAIEELKEDVRRDCQKSKGLGKRDTILKKLMKSAGQHNYCGWANCYSPVGDQFGFLDGYRAYVLNDSFGYARCERDPFNFDAAKPKKSAIKAHVDLDDLKFFIKDAKAQGFNKGRWGKTCKPYGVNAGEFTIWFNPDYLLEFCMMFDTDYIMVSGQVSPAVYESENGEWGMVLPVRPPVEQAAE